MVDMNSEYGELEFRPEVTVDEEAKDPGDPNGDVQVRLSFSDLYEMSGRVVAITEALRITKLYPNVQADIGAVLDVAEYIRTGKRGLPLPPEDCDW